jgi:hypothetical protein
MKTRISVFSITLAASIFILGEDASAKTAACPCSPCKCSPCTCGGGGKGGKHHDRHGHEHGGSVGVGGTVDLGGVGQRKREPDPFAVSGGGSTTSHTQEKHRTKTKAHEVTTTNPFTEIKLTGKEAKQEVNPPGPINVSDEETPPPLPKGEVFTPPTIDDLKKAADAYHTARSDFLKTDPDWKEYLKLLSYMNRIAGGSDQWKKASVKSYKLAHRAVDRFDHSDQGKKLLDDWMKDYQALNKPGTDIPDDLVPPDKLEQAKHNLAKAESKLKGEREIYDAWKENAVKDNAGIKNIQATIDALKKKVHFSDKEVQDDLEKVKQLERERDNARKQIEKDWAQTDPAKAQMKKVQQAEKDLDKAKAEFKPYEGLEKNPLQSNNP